MSPAPKNPAPKSPAPQEPRLNCPAPKLAGPEVQTPDYWAGRKYLDLGAALLAESSLSPPQDILFCSKNESKLFETHLVFKA
jgi:hypothetical protein